MHVLWDFDGTLATSRPIWSPVFDDLAGPIDASARAEAWRQWEAAFPWMQHTVPHSALFPEEEYYEYVARTLREALAGAGASTTVSADALRRAVVAHMHYVLSDGARGALDQSAALGHTNHLASNHLPDLPDLLATLKLRNCFRHTFISAIMGHEKPSHRFWERIEDTVGADPREMVMIGDDWVRDIEPTLARGYHAVWVAPPERRAQRADPLHRALTADCIAEVPSLLQKLGV